MGNVGDFSLTELPPGGKKTKLKSVPAISPMCMRRKALSSAQEIQPPKKDDEAVKGWRTA